MDGMGDFFGQPVIQRYVLVLIALGLVYVGMMTFFVRRSAERRRLKREQAKAAAVPMGYASTTASSYNRNRERVAPMSSPGDSELPEPDFHMLFTPQDEQESTDSAEQPPMMAQNAEPAPQEAAMPQPDAVESAPQQPEMTEMAVANVTAPAVQKAVQNESRAAATSDMHDAVEVMRVWRDLSDGRLIVELGGQRFRSLDEIRAPELARRLTAVVRELTTLVGLRTGAESPAAPMPAMGLVTPQLEAAPQKPKGFFSGLGRQNPSKDQPASPPSGIANAVEEFLQFKLSTTPEFSMRSIHIKPGRDQGVAIEVDGRIYDAVGDVEDPQVREFLSSMMQEWSARH